jgi:hypothetical protein
MFDSTVIDVGIGLVFVYLVLGLMCTTVNEWIAQMTSLRAKTLRSGIEGLLKSHPNLVTDFYNHPLVQSLSNNGKDPSYVPAKTFVMALLDSLPKAAAGADPLVGVKSSIDQLPDGHVKQSLLLLLQRSDNSLTVFEAQVAEWFEHAMDRVSGWYKQKSQVITIVVAALITIFANADTVHLARKLFLSPTVRKQIVAAAGEKPTGDLTQQQKAELGELTGWSQEFQTFHRLAAEHDHKPPVDDDSFPGANLFGAGVFWYWLWTILPGHILGWFLTAVAVSLGAPFWFDTLNKFMNIRAAGTAPNEKKQDLSKA